MLTHLDVRSGQLWTESISQSYVYIIIGVSTRVPTWDMEEIADRWWHVMFMDGSFSECTGGDIVHDRLLEDVPACLR